MKCWSLHHLNTSNVNVNQDNITPDGASESYLNTSNVNVNLTTSMVLIEMLVHLNTSNVNVNRNWWIKS